MRPLDPSLVVAVFLATGPQKQIAYRFGVSLGFVSNVKTRSRHTDITDTLLFNAALTTLAFTGAA